MTAAVKFGSKRDAVVAPLALFTPLVSVRKLDVDTGNAFDAVAYET